MSSAFYRMRHVTLSFASFRRASISVRSTVAMASNLLLPTLISTLVLSLPETAVAKVIATQLGPRVVETQYGKLRGVLTTLSNRHLPPVDAYYGLQYASVTGSELRFMPPTSPTDKWPGIRVAHNFKPVCPQPTSRIARAVADWTAARTSGTGSGSHTTGFPWIRWNARHIERLSRLLPFVERQHEECLYLNVYVPVVGE
jgi:Carboxylesterase family